MTEPVNCYILDGILLLYCIITTLLFFTAKRYNSSPEPKEDSTHSKRKQEASSDTYQALQIKDGSDAYQVIMSKGKKKKMEQVAQPLSAETQTRPTAPPH